MKQYTIRGSLKEEIDYIDDMMDVYNESQVPYLQERWDIDISHSILDESGELAGAIKAYIYGWNCLFIELFWIRSDCRRNGYGTALLTALLDEAKKRDCHLVHLDTFDFQAKDFYLKNGFEIFGVLEDCPVGHKRYYLEKRL